LVLDPQDPFYLGSGARLDYPPHVSLLQTWTAVWLGGWNDVLVNLPWAAYYVSAIVFLYATIAARIDRSLALAAAFCLAGLPLFVVHASIAGYAELMLSAHFLMAASMIFLWARERRTTYFLLGLLFTLSLP
jgi:4-amino-4-deoxy-L-arabinose transferase-like glycosyltransferase